MLDLVFAVDDPVQWHKENLEMNWDHYSALKYLGPEKIAKIQEEWACGVYYNPYVTVEKQLLKYGVVSTQTLNDDLYNWTHLYLAGRLHKPVLIVKPSNNSRTTMLLTRNREWALKIALLLSPRHCTKFDLYRTITGLSYIGDFRMSIGENPNKVSNIVSAMMPEFDKVYKPLIAKLDPLVVLDKRDRLVQETHHHVKFTRLMMLPHPIQRSLAKKIYPRGLLIDVEEALIELSHKTKLPKYIRRTIAEVTRGSSIRQTLQGIATAGPLRSIRYGFDKLKKKASGSSESDKSVISGLPAPLSDSQDAIVHKLTPVDIHDLETLHKSKLMEYHEGMLLGKNLKDPMQPNIVPPCDDEIPKKPDEEPQTTALITITNTDVVEEEIDHPPTPTTSQPKPNQPE